MRNLTSKNKNASQPGIALVFALIAVIGLFQILFFKISYSLNSGEPFNIVQALSGSDAIFNFFMTGLVVMIHLMVAGLLRRTFGERRVKTRYAVQFFVSGIAAAVGAALCAWFYSAVIFDYGTPSAGYFFTTAVLAFVIPVVLTGLLETFYYRGQWQREQLLAEQTHRQMVTAKFDALKNQLSPHFVFNSFNTLGAMIDESPSSAQEFLDRLSQIYRYILEHKDKDTVSLGRELESVMALLHIQESRHPGAVKLEIDIPEKCKFYQIIPLTLHTLAENVFKHNILSPENPIAMTIKIKKGEILYVENDLRPKFDVESHNIGISNLSKRYELLIQRGLKIIQGHERFTVEIPFIGAEFRSS